MERVIFDTELVQRYDGPGPRYTSYPTAVQFHEGFAADDYARLARLSNAKTGHRDLSLYVHIPFCAHVCFYCACNKVVTAVVTACGNLAIARAAAAGLRAWMPSRSTRVMGRPRSGTSSASSPRR